MQCRYQLGLLIGSKTPVCLVILASATLQARADFRYSPDFSTIEGLALVGDASHIAKKLRLAPAESSQVGGAWYVLDKQQVEDGFLTVFRFRMTETGGIGAADGLAFVVQNDSESALGGTGSAMGFAPIPNSIAVAFDTFFNRGEGDPNDNHIAVHTRGTDTNSQDHEYSLGETTDIPDFSDGNIHDVKIKYSHGLLRVYLDDFMKPVLTVSVDLAATLDLDSGRAWVGFTASTGGVSANHDILRWSFSAYRPGETKDLDGDGTVGTPDLATLLDAWGENLDHPADLDGDGNVGAADLIELLGNWGPCPE